MVRTLEIQGYGSVDCHIGELAYSACRIYYSRTGQQARLGIWAQCRPAEDNPRGHHGMRIRTVHDSFHGGEMALGLSLGFFLHGGSRLFRQSCAAIDSETPPADARLCNLRNEILI